MGAYFNDPEYTARIDRDVLANPSPGPVLVTSSVFGTLSSCRADVESRMRSLLMSNVGNFAGTDPVAMIACLK